MNAGLSQTKLIEYKMRSIFEVSSGRPHGPFMGLGDTNIPREKKRQNRSDFDQEVRQTYVHGVYLVRFSVRFEEAEESEQPNRLLLWHIPFIREKDLDPFAQYATLTSHRI